MVSLRRLVKNEKQLTQLGMRKHFDAWLIDQLANKLAKIEIWFMLFVCLPIVGKLCNNLIRLYNQLKLIERVERAFSVVCFLIFRVIKFVTTGRRAKQTKKSDKNCATTARTRDSRKKQIYSVIYTINDRNKRHQHSCHVHVKS